MSKADLGSLKNRILGKEVQQDKQILISMAVLMRDYNFQYSELMNMPIPAFSEMIDIVNYLVKEEQKALRKR